MKKIENLEHYEKSLKERLLFSQISNLIFIIIILILVLLQHFNILNINKSILPFYIIVIILYWLVIGIINIINLKKCEKQGLLRKYERKFAINIIITTISLILLGMMSIIVDKKSDINKFLPNSNKTVGYISDIDQNISFHRDDCVGGSRITGWCEINGQKYYLNDYYEVSYKYYVYYVVNGNNYETIFQEYDNLEYQSESSAEKSSPKHSKGEEITIYYNKSNPQDVRLNISTHSNLAMYILGIIIVSLQSFNLIYIFLFKNKNNLINNGVKKVKSFKDLKENQEEDDVYAPGWDAIDKEFDGIYPGQTNPKHYATLVSYELGGPDPLRGVSVYDSGDSWHFVTYGLTELYEKKSENKDISGYGMEFTFRLKKGCYDDEETEIKNIIAKLQSFARNTFEKGDKYLPYEYVMWQDRTKGIDSKQKSKITALITIPDVKAKELETPNGKVIFVEFVGITDKELDLILNKQLRVKELYEKLGTDITDYNRNSII